MSHLRLQNCFWLMLLTTIAGGCGGYAAEKHRVDAGEARSLLVNVLTSWRQGETPESWNDKKPQVVIQDRDWQNGVKLIAFEMLGDDRAVDANLHCKVKLTLEDASKGKFERTITYLVGTSPVLTVFRQVGS